MSTLQNLLTALDERTIARRIGTPHDEARMQYALRSNTVSGFDDFSWVIGDYYNYHFTRCVSGGGNLSRSEATGRAKEILEREYRRTNGDIVSAFNDCHDGTNGGVRAALDRICEAIKAESVERYIRDVFDVLVAPNAWEDKVELIREFIAQCGMNLGSSIQADKIERYAHDYQILIRSYCRALQQTSSVFRRI